VCVLAYLGDGNRAADSVLEAAAPL
jgi:hypothetical protein